MLFDPECHSVALGAASAIRSADRGILAKIIWFGSSAQGTQQLDSDVDILVLVDPLPLAWKPSDNIAERLRLEAVIGPRRRPVDLWVRTIDQFAEANTVIGGIEYGARAGHIVFERPTRAPVVRQPREAILRRNIIDWVELARRLLGRSAMVNFGRAQSTQAHPASHYAKRSTTAAIGAVLIAHETEPLSKRDPVGACVDRLTAMDRKLGKRLAFAADSPPTTHLAHRVLRMVVAHLAGDLGLSPLLSDVVTYVARPTQDLGNVTPLKFTAFRSAPIFARRRA